MSFSREDTVAKIAALVAKELKIEAQSVSESANLQDLGADSLDLMKLTMKIEDQFGIEIDDEKAEKLLTVGQVVDYVHSLRTK